MINRKGRHTIRIEEKKKKNKNVNTGEKTKERMARLRKIAIKMRKWKRG